MNRSLNFDFLYHPVADEADYYACDCCAEQVRSDADLNEVQHERYSYVCANCKDMIESEAAEEEAERHEHLRRLVAIRTFPH